MKPESTSAQDVRKNDVLDAAAAWHNRLNEEQPSPITLAEFAAWTDSDPSHRAAFEAIDQVWSQLAGARLDPRIMEMRRKALIATQRRAANRLRIAAAAAILALIVGVAWLLGPSLPELTDTGTVVMQRKGEGSLRTAVGERSNMTLADGSVVILNTNTRIDIDFTSTERHLRLSSGQAWFEVAKDPNRPFIVEAGHQRVVALGTAFDVRVHERGNAVQVTLVEGKVSVAPIQLPLISFLKPETKPAELAPGESLIASEDGSVRKTKADVVQIGSWRQGQLVFDNDSLESAVAEINRYSAIQIELAEPRIAAYRLSGVFKAGHSESFIETVVGHYPIRVVERSGRRIVLASREQ